MKVLVMIPAYNEAESLASLIAKLRYVCPEYDILVINDGSRDLTSEIARKSGADVIDLPVNLGIGGAVQSGFIYACSNNYDAAVQVDGDGQHDPEYIHGLIDGLGNGVDLCIGSRFINNKGYQSTSARRLGIRHFSRLIRMVTGLQITDPTSGFRACSKNAIRLFAEDYPRDYPEPESIVIASCNGLRISEKPVVMGMRKEGRSSITIIKSLYYIIKVSIAVVIASLYLQRRISGHKV